MVQVGPMFSVKLSLPAYFARTSGIIVLDGVYWVIDPESLVDRKRLKGRLD